MKFFKCFIIFAVILSLTSCSYFYSGSFEGGELLDDELMASIKAELFSTEESSLGVEEITAPINEIATEDSSEISSDTTRESTTEAHLSESSLETTSEAITAIVTESVCDTETIYESTDLVYWTANGSVWHTFKDCGHLKNSKSIESGSIEKAIESGKAKLCSTCEKRERN